MIQLVVNADDLGLNPSIDDGILRAHRDGIVTSATLLATGPCAAEAVARAKAQGLALGLHLCLSTRLPCAAPAGEVPTVAPGGHFRSSWSGFVRAWATGRVRLSEVERELAAQVTRAKALGATLDHLDGHQHLHVLPGIAPIALRMAQREGLSLRWPVDRPRRDWWARPSAAAKALAVSAVALAGWPRGAHALRGLGVFDAGRLDEPTVLRLLEALPPGVYELGAHPGLHPGRVPEDPQWQYGWQSELEALCSARVRALLTERGIALTTYGALRSGV